MSEDKALKVMESKVREAMNSCPQAKEVLARMFGEQIQPPPPRIQRGDIVCGRGKHDGRDIHDYYGVVIDSFSPYVVKFFHWNKGWYANSAHWSVPAEKLELVYRPEK